MNNILKYPNNILCNVSSIVDSNDNVSEITTKLIQTITNTKNCIGLSAPQIGILKRVIIVDSLIDTETRLILNIPKYYILINPIITNFSKDVIKDNEGCMSFPGGFEKVSRYNKIVVEYKDNNFKTNTLNASGLLSRCIQHEIDHLDGILLIDRMSPIRRNRFLRKYNLKVK